jgi:predicted regulator of amino acid metabolism with ACT domain
MRSCIKPDSDKIVKRVINEILHKAGLRPVNDDMEFIMKAEEIALACGYRPIELCWMTWLIQPKGKIMRMEKYSDILSEI